MPEKVREPQPNPLVLQTVYPDAAAIFSFQPEPLTSVLADCVVVLDTNVLLVPYNTGKESLEQIRKTYSALAGQSRLVIPGQVAREFAQNRSEKLKTVFQQVSRKRDTSIKRQGYPLLESVLEYQEVVRLEQKIDAELSEYRKALGRLLEAIGAWYWNDPVSALYREVFGGDVVYEPKLDESAFMQDLDRRQDHKIPPGYKDAGKSDRGVGDLLIWRSILELGQSRKKHLIFVSGDEKSDWWHRSENQALFPRFELIDEYRRESDGKSFYLIGFAELLKHFGASSEVVNEVRQEEAIANFETSTSVHAAQMARAAEAERAVFRWLSKTYPASRIIVSRGSGPDFLVPDPTGIGILGFDVRYVHSARSVMMRPRHFDERLLQRLPPEVRRVYVVYAAETDEATESLMRLVPRRALTHPLLGYIIGTIDADGIFREVLRSDPESDVDTV